MEAPDTSAVLECPECKQQSLSYDIAYKLYNCTNETCKLTFSEKDMARIQQQKTIVPEKAKKRRKPKRIKYKRPRTSPSLLWPFKIAFYIIATVANFIWAIIEEYLVWALVWIAVIAGVVIYLIYFAD